MKEDINFQKKIYSLLLFFLFFIFLYATYLMSKFLIPMFFAFFTAMFLHPFIKKMYKTKMPNWLSIIIVYLLFTLIIAVILTVIGISFGNFIGDLPDITEVIRIKIVNLIVSLSKTEVIKQFFYKEEVVSAILKVVTDLLSIENFKTYIIKPVGVTINILTAFGLYVLYLIFIIPVMDKINNKILKAFPGEKGNKINDLITNIKEQIQKYIVVKSIISFGVGLFSLLICLIFGIKYTLLWGAVIFLLNYIPYIGSFVAVSFPLLLCIIQYQSPIRFLLLASILITIQIIMANIVEPKFMSRGVNLNPLVIITSLLFCGYLWGISGVILAVPIVSAINLIFANIESLKPVSIMISTKNESAL